MALPLRSAISEEADRSALGARLRRELAVAGRDFYRRGWALGTSGNFSAVLSENPLTLVVTPTGADKGRLRPADLLVVDESGGVISGVRKPSAETLLHLTIAKQTGAGSVLHTHSIAATVLSGRHERGVRLHGFEMLKGLAGVGTHQHTEWAPIVENSQDYPALANEIEILLAADPFIHAVLLRRHGLYTWGRDVSEARRHVEILEFLLAVALESDKRGN